MPKEANVQAPPVWQLLSPGKTWEWHDHRIHWSGSGSPAGIVKPVDGKFEVRAWGISILVGGKPSIVEGSLVDYVQAQVGDGFRPTGGSSVGVGLILAVVLPVCGALVAAAGLPAAAPPPAARHRRRLTGAAAPELVRGPAGPLTSGS